MADIRIVPAQGAINVTGSADFKGTGGSTILYLTGSGQIGAGTTSPDSEFHIVGSGTRFVTLDRSGTRSYDLGVNSSGTFLVTDNTAAADRIALNHSGSVGIGTTGPIEPLQVIGNIRATYDGSNYSRLGQNSSGGYIQAYSGNVEKIMLRSYGASFFTGGSVGIGTTNPAYPLQLNSTTGGGGMFSLLNTSGTESSISYRISNGAANTGWVVGNASNSFFFYSYTYGGQTLSLSSTGAVKIGKYGSGTITGTAAYNLSVDSSGNIIETANSSLTGTGTTNYVTKWSGTNSLTDSIIYDTGTNVGIGSTAPEGKLNVVGSADVLIVEGSGSTSNTTIMAVDGNNGRLFEVSDDLSDSLFSVNTIAGLPVMEAFADNTVTLGAYNQYDLHITGSSVGIGTSAPVQKLDVRGDSYFSGRVGIGTTTPAANGLSIEETGNHLFLRASTATAGKYWNFDVTSANQLYIINNGGTGVTVTDVGNVGIGLTNPSYKLDVNGTAGFSSTIYAANIGTGTDDSVVILDSDGTLRTDEIDSRVWGTSLVDGSGTANYISKWSDANTLTDSIIYDNGTNVGIGITSATAKLHILYSGDNNPGLRLQGDGNDTNLEFRTNNDYATVQAYDSGFTNVGTLALNPASGSVSIGTTLKAVGGAPGGGSGSLNVYTSIGAGSWGQQIRHDSTTGNGLFIRAAQTSTYYTAYFTGYDESNVHFVVRGDGRVGIGNASPPEKLTVEGNISASGLVYVPNIGTGTDNSVVILDSDGTLRTDEIDSRVWGSTLVDGSGTANYISKWSDANTLADSQIFDNGTTVGIGVATPQSKLDLNVAPAQSTISTLGYSANASLNIRIPNTVGDVGQIVFTNASGPTAGYGSIGVVMTSGTGVGLGDIIIATKSVGTDAVSTERFRITSGGNVGINTTAPVARLEVYENGADTTLRIHEDAGTHVARLALRSGGNDTWIQNTVSEFTIRTETNLTSTPAIRIGSTAGDVTFGYNVNINGDLTVDGIITAKEFHTTFVSASIIYQSGSTQFGNSSDDIHTFTGNISASALLYAPNIGAGVDNSVVILDSDGTLRTDEIDSRVWGSTLVDGSGTANYVTKWSDANTLTDSIIFDNGTNVGIGVTTPSGKLEIRGLRTASKNLLLNLSKFDYGGTAFYQNYSNTFYTNGKSLEVEVEALALLQLATNNAGTEGKVIFPNGNVGIGNTSPLQMLHVESGSMLLTRALGDADYDAINIAYRGSWSNYTNKLAGINVTDSNTLSQTVGRFGVTYNGSNGAFIITDLYDGGYAASGDVFRAVGNGTIVFPQYGAGFLKTDANGSITADSTDYIPTTDYDDFVNVTGDTMSGTLTITTDTVYPHVSASTSQLKVEGSNQWIEFGTPNILNARRAWILARHSGLPTYGGFYSTLNIQPRVNGTISDYEGVAIGYGPDFKFGSEVDLAVAGSVGIGTSSPLVKLEVVGDTYLRTTVFTDTIRPYTADQLTLLNGGNNRLYVNGSVGIGTTSPTDKLYIRNTGGADAGMVLDNSTQRLRIDQNSIRTETASQIAIFTNNTLANGLYINSTGNIGVGMSAPTALLHVSRSLGAAWLASFENQSVSGHGLLIRAGGTTGTRYITQWYDAAGNQRFNMQDTGEIYAPNIGTGVDNSVVILDSDGTLRTDEIDSRVWGSSLTDGSGTANYISKWSDANTLTDSIIFDNGSVVGIGTTNPNFDIDVRRTKVGDSVRLRLRNDDTTNTSSHAYLNIASEAGDPFIQFDFGGATIYSLGVDNSDGNKFKLSNGSSTYNPGDGDLITVTTTGNVGIGTTNPASTLQVNGNFRLYTTNSDSNELRGIFNVGGTADPLSFSMYKADATTVGTYLTADGASYFMGGDVGIGITNPPQKLSVFGNIYQRTGDYITWSNGDAQIGAVSGYALAFSTYTGVAMTEKLRITSNGNVGIGSTAPEAKLNVVGGADVLIVEGSGSTANTTIMAVDGNNGRLFEVSDDLSDSLFSVNTIAGLPVMEAFADNTVILGAYNQCDLVVTGSKVGIGNCTPQQTLHVGTGTDTGNFIQVETTTADLVLGSDSGATNLGITNGAKIMQSNSYPLAIGTIQNQELYLSANNAIVVTVVSGNVGISDTTPSYKLDVNGTIRATGDVIAYSDQRVKENVVTLENSLELVKSLRGVSYNKIGEPEKKVGVIAQEILEVLPEVVQQDSEGMYSVAYGNITAVLIEAIKEQQLQIEELREEIKKLKG